MMSIRNVVSDGVLWGGCDWDQRCDVQGFVLVKSMSLVFTRMSASCLVRNNRCHRTIFAAGGRALVLMLRILAQMSGMYR